MIGLETGNSSLLRATVLTVDDAGAVVVASDDTPGERLACDVLDVGAGRLVLEIGNVVLVWRQTDGRGVVVGRIANSRAEVFSQVDGVPDSLVLEAKQSLTLRVGDGSITIRGDGKILIKGKDLVSHAQRMNRIKGGAVSIN